MKKKKNALSWIIAALIITLLAVLGLMVYKQLEYSQSADYYDSLRGERQPFAWLIPSAFAEESVVQDADALHFLVDSMFAAAVGTTEAEERSVRANMTDDEQVARNTVNAQYRAQTLPWLQACFQPADDWKQPPAKEEARYTTEHSYAAMQQNALGRAYLEALKPFGAEDYEACLEISRRIARQWIGEIDHAALKEINRHYQLWICAPGTKIDYPVVQCSDNERYLKKLFNGRRNANGTLFIDYRNLTRLRDPNTLVYGHHMRNQSMFGTLVFYKEQAYYEAHPWLLLIDPENVWLLELFAGYTTTDQDHCYDIAISDERDLKRFVDAANAKSNFASPVQVQPSDRLITMSTCAYSFQNARYIAIGRVVPWWQNPQEVTDP